MYTLRVTDPLPTCAICARPVERLTTEEDQHLELVRVRVYCHGDIERVDISFRDMNEARELRFTGIAFCSQPRRLNP